jgi:hypothetical protein
MFVGGLAGACLAKDCLVLDAVAAEKMPHRLIVSGVERSPFFELRNYGSREVAGVLRRCGLHPVLEEDGRLLFAFETLAAREMAWREISTNVEWIHCSAGTTVREIAIYRERGV